MNKERFEELTEAIRQAKAVRRGQAAPSRVWRIGLRARLRPMLFQDFEIIGDFFYNRCYLFGHRLAVLCCIFGQELGRHEFFMKLHESKGPPKTLPITAVVFFGKFAMQLFGQMLEISLVFFLELAPFRLL
jgi:hypothetical protein